MEQNAVYPFIEARINVRRHGHWQFIWVCGIRNFRNLLDGISKFTTKPTFYKMTAMHTSNAYKERSYYIVLVFIIFTCTLGAVVASNKYLEVALILKSKRLKCTTLHRACKYRAILLLVVQIGMPEIALNNYIFHIIITSRIVKIMHFSRLL